MARPRFALVWPALVALTVAFSADAEGKKCRMPDKPKTAITFQITGPLGLKIDGTSSELKINDDGSKITLTAGLTNLKTGIGFRDGHLKEHINTAKWKDMTLVVDKASLKIPGSGKTSGKLTWRDKTVDRSVNYTVKRLEHDMLDVSGNFEVDLKQHGSDKACKGVCTGTIVKVSANFQAVEG
jgi:polyisoprenoid-binding protein YceI